MIIFDDRYIDQDEAVELHNALLARRDWSTDPDNPLISTVSIDVNPDELSLEASFFVKKLDSFANSSRIDVKRVESITLIKMDRKSDKQELEYESPEIDEEDGNLLLFISTNSSDAHTYVFNEESGEAKSADDLTVFTMFSPVAGRGFIVFPQKYYALSLPQEYENQYFVKIKFKGDIVQNQASVVYHMDM
jgi:hypothetical protein